MSSPISRRPGRPTNSTKTPSDFSAELWTRVRIHRIKERLLTGKTPTVAKACEALFETNLLKFAVGGQFAALEIANLKRKKRWHRFRLDEGSGKLVADANGSIFLSHQVESASSLHARFSEANKLVESNPLVRLTWMNLCRQRLGRPIKKPDWANPWKPKSLYFKADGSFCLS